MTKRLRRWLAVLAALGLTAGYGFWSSSVVHVRRAEVMIADLPAAFDGTTILFVSDIDLVGMNTSSRAARVFKKLQSLSPDLLLLGGDYASPSLYAALNGTEVVDPSRADGLWKALTEFEAPLGKFAICGENDGSAESLAARLSVYGISAIDGKLAVVEKDGSAIGIAGIGSTTENIGALAAGVQNDQCVIVLCHSPARIIDIRVAEAADGGVWSDLVLCGHTHGGQMRLFGRTMLALNETEQQFISGWFEDSNMSMLVSSGFGCENLNLRIGTQSEVWLLTLRRKTEGIVFG